MLFCNLETSVQTKLLTNKDINFIVETFFQLIGKLFSKDNAAYGLLSESAAFPYGEALNNILRKLGL
jgi:demethylmenaquinone methyltransferase/2-methoxy-6-polyprenyl-1,4-benzoquinol methylase